MERKLATVLFVDLVGSTQLVAASDPEVVRRRVNSFFEHVSHCITTHGGIVEKFAGDAVMAAFGIPQALFTQYRAARALSAPAPIAVAAITDPSLHRLNRAEDDGIQRDGDERAGQDEALPVVGERHEAHRAHGDLPLTAPTGPRGSPGLAGYPCRGGRSRRHAHGGASWVHFDAFKKQMLYGLDMFQPE